MLIFYSYIEIWKKCRCKWVHIWSHIQYDSTVFYLWLLLTLNSKYVFISEKKEKNSPPYSTATLSRRKQESKKMMLKDFNNLKDSFRFDSFNIRCTSNVEWKVIHTRTAYCIRKLFYAHIFHNQLYHSCLKGHRSTVSQNYFQMLPGYHCKNNNRRNLVLLC